MSSPTTTVHVERTIAPGSVAAPVLGLDARMALVEAAMTVRLDMAALRLGVDTAHPDTAVDLADTIRVPVAVPPAPLTLYPTPVAALLQRAVRRLETGGWCAGTLVDTDGARCLYGAIQAEATTPETEAAALDVLLEAIRRRFPAAETVPSFNDSRSDAREPLRLMRRAADLANARGI